MVVPFFTGRGQRLLKLDISIYTRTSLPQRGDASLLFFVCPDGHGVYMYSGSCMQCVVYYFVCLKFCLFSTTSWYCFFCIFFRGDFGVVMICRVSARRFVDKGVVRLRSNLNILKKSVVNLKILSVLPVFNST